MKVFKLGSMHMNNRAACAYGAAHPEGMQDMLAKAKPLVIDGEAAKYDVRDRVLHQRPEGSRHRPPAIVRMGTMCWASLGWEIA